MLKPSSTNIHTLWSLCPKTCLLQHFFELLSRRSELVAVPHDLRRRSSEKVDAAFPTSSLGAGTGVGIAGISTNWPMVGTWRTKGTVVSRFFLGFCFQATRHLYNPWCLKKCPTPPSECHLSFCLEIAETLWNTPDAQGLYLRLCGLCKCLPRYLLQQHQRPSGQLSFPNKTKTVRTMGGHPCPIGIPLTGARATRHVSGWQESWSSKSASSKWEHMTCWTAVPTVEWRLNPMFISRCW